MNDLSQTASLDKYGIQIETDGEFAGWRTWRRDNFETHTGPFYHRVDENGRVTCAFRVVEKHLNGSGNVHGGCFMTFADYCLFALATPVLQGSGVTVSFASEFLDAARKGELIECVGEVMRAGMSLIFVRGMLMSGTRPLFSFSGTIKRVRRKAPAPTP
ncbi:PaaI family thioesterase [Bradyrhizobium sp. WSM 1704]|uniref:PaaI family thioesterase n=1 Tax=Bradyrhizobium semiaridum TaxID=2821404 RepID=UPI001CE29380|nr:PaaI family thioesterase [Bradyrhizobium semiaridum]MCA6124173.1 PaaI family thioesterase [Bradyrhizobium semiaridum]